MKRALFTIAVLSAVFTCTGAPITWSFTVDTSSISGSSGFLDFQFNPGPNATQAAFVEISAFAPAANLGAEQPPVGDVSGALPSTVTIQNSQALNDYFQAFLFGNSLTFDVFFDGPALTSPDGISSSGSTFAFGLYDSTQSPILTTDPSGAAAVVDVDLDGGTMFQSFPSGGGGSVVSADTVPEPGTLGMAAFTLLGLSFLRFRR
jgi:hypothetical protein